MRRPLFIAFLALPLGAAADTSLRVSADIVGRVLLKGRAPAPLQIAPGRGHPCDKAHFTETVLATDGRLANVLVYVAAGATGRFEVPHEPAVLRQECCRYEPHVLAMMAGQRIVFRNDDEVRCHNVHPLPKLNREMNGCFARRRAEVSDRWNVPEIGIRVKCDVHPWELAYVHVLRHSYFAVTGPDGMFRLSGLPRGPITLAAWHEKYGERTVKLETGRGTRIEFVFEEEP